jgi:multisubunit Na+/H+ antiporter MnhE subunit
LELLGLVASRPVVIALAMAGAIVATIGSWLMRNPGRLGARRARLVLRIGYGITGVSVFLFIVAGFMA